MRTFSHITRSALVTSARFKFITKAKPKKDNPNMTDQIPQMQLVEAKPMEFQQEPSVALMLQKVIEGGITKENVTALESLVGLYDRMQAKNAEKDFAVAFNRLMAEMPPIQATKPVPNNDGTVRYRFAPLEEIEAIVRPVALRNGFSYSFSEGQSEPGRITKICTVQHSSGHKRVHPFTVRTSAPPKANDSQADGSTHSYAKRGAFSDAFSIIVDHDDDARMIGKPIGQALALDLEDRVAKVGADENAFLKYAGAKTYAEISDERYPALDELLKRKEAAK